MKEINSNLIKKYKHIFEVITLKNFLCDISHCSFENTFERLKNLKPKIK